MATSLKLILHNRLWLKETEQDHTTSKNKRLKSLLNINTINNGIFPTNNNNNSSLNLKLDNTIIQQLLFNRSINMRLEHTNPTITKKEHSQVVPKDQKDLIPNSTKVLFPNHLHLVLINNLESEVIITLQVLLQVVMFKANKQEIINKVEQIMSIKGILIMEEQRMFQAHRATNIRLSINNQSTTLFLKEKILREFIDSMIK